MPLMALTGRWRWAVDTVPGSGSAVPLLSITRTENGTQGWLMTAVLRTGPATRTPDGLIFIYLINIACYRTVMIHGLNRPRTLKLTLTTHPANAMPTAWKSSATKVVKTTTKPWYR